MTSNANPASGYKKILSLQDLAAEADLLRSADKRIVTTNGCFDLLHVGHIRFLKSARALGDVLIVGLNSDSSVRSLKGTNRPLIAQDERAEILAALSCVDYVSIFPEVTASEFLHAVKPDIYVKGGDYEPSQLPETSVVESLGGLVKILKYVPQRSSTDLIEKIKSAEA